MLCYRIINSAYVFQYYIVMYQFFAAFFSYIGPHVSHQISPMTTTFHGSNPRFCFYELVSEHLGSISLCGDSAGDSQRVLACRRDLLNFPELGNIC